MSVLFPINFSIRMGCDLPIKTVSQDYQVDTKSTNKNVA